MEPTAWLVEHDGQVIGIFTDRELMEAHKAAFPHAQLRAVYDAPAALPLASVEQAIARLWPNGLGPKNLDELVAFIEEERKCDAEYLENVKAGRSSAEPVVVEKPDDGS